MQMEPHVNLVKVGNLNSEDLNIQSAAELSNYICMRRIKKVATSRFKVKLYCYKGARNEVLITNQQFSNAIRQLGQDNHSFLQSDQASNKDQAMMNINQKVKEGFDTPNENSVTSIDKFQNSQASTAQRRDKMDIQLTQGKQKSSLEATNRKNSTFIKRFSLKGITKIPTSTRFNKKIYYSKGLSKLYSGLAKFY